MDVALCQDAEGLRRTGHIDENLDKAAALQAKQLEEEDDTSGNVLEAAVLQACKL